MTVAKEEKQIVIEKHRIHERDTGSAQVQIAILTERIRQLAPHFQAHKKDHHSRRGLLMMVGKRRSFLAYLKRHDLKVHNKLLNELGIRG